MVIFIILFHKALCQSCQRYHLFFWRTVIILVRDDKSCSGQHVCSLMYFIHSLMDSLSYSKHCSA